MVRYVPTQMKLRICQISRSIPGVRVRSFGESVNGFRIGLAMARSVPLVLAWSSSPVARNAIWSIRGVVLFFLVN